MRVEVPVVDVGIGAIIKRGVSVWVEVSAFSIVRVDVTVSTSISAGIDVPSSAGSIVFEAVITTTSCVEFTAGEGSATEGL